MAAAAAAKRCHYEVLGLPRDCAPDEIRSAYRRLALQRHPDKLVKSGISQEEATAQFQELQHAYEVLSDPKERAWYDSHRSQILFSDPNTVSNSFVPDLFSFFSNTVYSGYSDTAKGFYKVYSDVFDKIHANEINFARKLGLGVDAVRQAPVMGNLDSPYAQVTAFYSYWLGFCTVMDFCWVDEYDVMAGPNRKSRRLMEEENNKARRKARREYNDTVRRLGDFVEKRDKRVIDMKEFYCVLCKKKFKSEKQWKNHEQSKKHKERVAEFRDSIGDEEDLEEEEEEEGKEGLESEEDQVGVNDEIDNGIGDLEARIRDGVNVEEGETRNGIELNDGDEFFDASRVKEGEEANVKVNFRYDGNDEDDENGVLEAMVAGHKNRKPRASAHKPKASVAPSPIENENDELGSKEYNNRKGARKKRGAKKEKGRKNWEESQGAASSGDYENINSNGNDNSHAEESCSQHFVENEDNGIENEQVGRDDKISNQPADKKGRDKNISHQPADTKGAGKDTKTKAKVSSKGRKGKVTSKNVGNICEACGEEFDSRNKLHKHLGDSGHATIKGR